MSFFTFFATFTTALLLDRLTKLLAMSYLSPADSVPRFASLALSFNRGISFSLFSDGSWGLLFSLAGLLAFALVSVKYRYFRTSPGGALLWAGAAGNLADRILYGHVVDWLYIGLSINLADIWLCIGGVTILLRYAGKQGKGNCPLR